MISMSNTYLIALIHIVDNDVGVWIGQYIGIDVVTLYSIDSVSTSVDIRQILTV